MQQFMRTWSDENTNMLAHLKNKADGLAHLPAPAYDLKIPEYLSGYHDPS